MDVDGGYIYSMQELYELEVNFMGWELRCDDGYKEVTQANGNTDDGAKNATEKEKNDVIESTQNATEKEKNDVIESTKNATEKEEMVYLELIDVAIVNSGGEQVVIENNEDMEYLCYILPNNEEIVVNKSEDNKLIDEEKRRRKFFRDKKARVDCEEKDCKKTFKSKGNMKLHLATKDVVICEHCGKHLMGKTNYKVHLKLIHADYVIKLRCHICHTEFDGANSLKRHVDKHDKRIAGGKFECDVCHIFLTQKASVGRHMRAVHKK